MSKNPEEYSMRGENREMSVLFSDVRDFTSISEGLTAEALKDMMNAYLTAMTEVIQDRRGTIDKYIGDAIMAFWGAPIGDSGAREARRWRRRSRCSRRSGPSTTNSCVAAGRPSSSASASTAAR
jgi:class 3 adenylate cyclase